MDRMKLRLNERYVDDMPLQVPVSGRPGVGRVSAVMIGSAWRLRMA
jgi:hypothetical protein